MQLRVIQSILAAIVIVAIVGCGGQGDRTAAQSTAPAPPTTDTVPASPSPVPPATRLIKHDRGETEVPANPQRIAVLNDVGYEDNLLAMGVKPYIASTFPWSKVGFYPHIADDLQGVHGMEGHSPNLERLAQLEPDLIIINGTNEKVYEQLSKIAPTVLVKFNADWRVTHRRLGEIVGKQQEAEAILEAYDKRLAEVKSGIKQTIGDEAVMIAVINNEKTVRIQGVTGHALNDMLYRDLELKPTTGIPTAEQRMEVSFEGLSTLEPDHIFMQKNRSHTDEEARKSVLDNPIWAQMKAVKEEQLYIVDNWLAMSWGPKGRNMILEQLSRFLTAK